jgi:hypothetical protein
MNDLIEKLSNLRSQYNCFDENERDAYHTLSEAIKVLSEQLKPCEDAVSRRKLLNDLGELITAWEKYPIMAEQIKGVETAIKYVEMIPSVTPKSDQCEDAVSRKSILDKISEKDNWEKYDRYNLGLSDARRIVQDEPSVTPKRKTGKWKPISDGYLDIYECDQCSETEDYERNYCPNCGADMRGDNE